MEDKAKRILQLKEWRYNTPKIMKIPYRTRIDEELKKKLKQFAGSAKKMTIRTYSHRDEMKEFKTAFYPEIPTKTALKKIAEFVKQYNVLLQEAIDVNTTLITGNVAIRQNGSGFYDILKGRYRVRDVDRPPPGATRISIIFNSFGSIQDNDMRGIIYSLKDIPFLVPFKEGVIIEFDLHEEDIGEKKENLLIWEYRPM